MNNKILKYFILAICICVIQNINSYGQVPSITYNVQKSYITGKQIDSLKPKVITGTPTNYLICPNLPAGLKFDEKTGVITGKPEKASNQKYCIFSANSSGVSKPFQICIIVKDSSDNVKKADVSLNCCNVKVTNDLGFGEWVLVFLPIILFLIFLIPFLFYIKSSEQTKIYSLRNALSESGYSQVIKRNDLYEENNLQKLIALQASNTTVAIDANTFIPLTITTTDDKYRPSISRLIVFLTSILSLVIGLCISCFFIYCYLTTYCIPDLSKLTGVLISMGIGVIPYAANKVGSGLANKTA